MRKTAEHYTSPQAAEELGCCTARIRQLCIKHEHIGEKFGRDWWLTEADISSIRNLDEFGKRKPKTKRKKAKA